MNQNYPLQDAGGLNPHREPAARAAWRRGFEGLPLLDANHAEFYRDGQRAAQHARAWTASPSQGPAPAPTWPDLIDQHENGTAARDLQAWAADVVRAACQPAPPSALRSRYELLRTRLAGLMTSEAYAAVVPLLDSLRAAIEAAAVADEVNATLWAERDELKAKSGYSDYARARHGRPHLTFRGYVRDLFACAERYLTARSSRPSSLPDLESLETGEGDARL